MALVSWTEIQSFHNIRKYTLAVPDIMKGNSTISYKAKVKLHGANMAIQIPIDGPVVAQSRTTELTEKNDPDGFARWVATSPFTKKHLGYILYGEWCGPGIQKGVAVSNIPRKIFAVFAARPLDGSYVPDQLITDPERLKHLVGDIPDTYVLPWHYSIDINWNGSEEELISITDKINEQVFSIEKNDPWVEATFGVKGTGEGLVFYPVSEQHLGYENFCNLVFKAKGEKYKNIKNSAPAQIDPAVAASIEQFIDMVLTEARLEQGVQATTNSSFDIKFIGKFLTWIESDVKKETKDELTVSKLEWDQVQKPLLNKARAWYIGKFRK